MDKYKHYVALDWAKANMAIARMTGVSDKIHVIDVPSDVNELKVYLKKLVGSKVLTIEETTTSQWLYTELKACVDKVVICDSYRNKLLSDGPSNDKADAKNLVKLLRSGLLKEVYHSGEEFLKLRKIVSGYEDLVKSGVRLKNQKDSFLRSEGKTTDNDIKDKILRFVLGGVNKGINNYEAEKERYEELFKQLSKKYLAIRNQASIDGIGYRNAIKIVARVINAERFAQKGDYILYCGLLKYDELSGGKSYGKRTPRYCRQLKSVYKTAAITVIGHDNYFNDYYEHLVNERKFPEYQARHAVARRIAAVSYGVMKSGKKFNPIRRNKLENKKVKTAL